jgi:hypothetical protein
MFLLSIKHKKVIVEVLNDIHENQIIRSYTRLLIYNLSKIVLRYQYPQ